MRRWQLIKKSEAAFASLNVETKKRAERDIARNPALACKAELEEIEYNGLCWVKKFGFDSKRMGQGKDGKVLGFHEKGKFLE